MVFDVGPAWGAPGAGMAAHPKVPQQARVAPHPAGAGRVLAVSGGFGYALPTVPPPADAKPAPESDSPALALAGLLLGAVRGHRPADGRTVAGEAWRHWQACGTCARCRGLEAAAVAFVQRWGLLGLRAESRWGYAGPEAPDWREANAALRATAWEPLGDFLLHAARLGTWLECYDALVAGGTAGDRARAQRLMLALLDGGDYTEGREDAWLLHPGLNTVLRDVSPRLDAMPWVSQADEPKLQKLQDAPDGKWPKEAGPPPVLQTDPRQAWDYPSLWAASHLDLWRWLATPGTRLRACARPDCRRPVLVEGGRQGPAKRYCSNTCRNTQHARDHARGGAAPGGAGPA